VGEFADECLRHLNVLDLVTCRVSAKDILKF
jgi:hypothetical protein